MVEKLQDRIDKMDNKHKQSSNGINPKTGKAWQRYCDTNGYCNHWGRNCQDKTKDHIIRVRQRFETEWEEVTLIVYQLMNDDWEEREN